MTTKDVLSLALEALAANEFHLVEIGQRGNGLHAQTVKAITAIKQAITPETGNAATPDASAITAGNGQQAQEPVSELEKLRDPAVLHANLLRGFPALLTTEQLWHIIGEVQQKALIAKFAEPAPKQAEPAWQPIETAPKDGKILLGVWEGDWNNPKQRFKVYEATMYKTGPSWAMKASYRTEEGGAYEIAGWMPLPTPPEAKA